MSSLQTIHDENTLGAGARSSSTSERIFPCTREIAKRFWSKVSKGANADCWPWLAYRDKDGYGQFWLNGTNVRATAVALLLVGRPLKNGECGLHTCDNPSCCNPFHLFAGTREDNVADRESKGRTAKGDSHGCRKHPETIRKGERHHFSKLTPEIVRLCRYLYLSGKGTLHGLARQYNVAYPVMRSAVSGKTWSHVDDSL